MALLKTGRLLRLFRVARRISRYIEYTVSLLGLLMLSFALLGHWFACVWYVIGYDELLEGKHKGWLYSLGEYLLDDIYTAGMMMQDFLGLETMPFHCVADFPYF